MTTMSIIEARNNFAETLNRVRYGGERILFARRGKPVAALVSAEDLALLDRMEDALDLKEVRSVRREYERNPESFITLKEYKKTLARP